MGINSHNMDLLNEHVIPRLPKEFSVYELGNQMVRADPDYPAAQYYYKRGAAHYDCIDINGGESINANLNYPIKLEPRDLVTDFGTSEHVFNIAQCWENIHNMVKPGGLVVVEKIYQGGTDHGFFNLQPTFFESFAAYNNYRIIYKHVTDHKIDQRFRVVMRKEELCAFAYPTQLRYRSMLDGQ